MSSLSPDLKVSPGDGREDKVTSQNVILLAKFLQLSARHFPFKEHDFLRNLLADPANVSLLVRYAGLSEELNALLLRDTAFGNDVETEKSLARITSSLMGVKAVPFQNGMGYDTKSVARFTKPDDPRPSLFDGKYDHHLKNVVFDNFTTFVPSNFDIENTIDDLNTASTHNNTDETLVNSNPSKNESRVNDLSISSIPPYLAGLLIICVLIGFIFYGVTT